MKTTPVKGCVDYLPQEAELRSNVIEKILEAYKKNGFLQIKTPILENLENLVSGDSGDNAKLMFKTLKRGAKLNLNKENLTENDLAEEGLRYDLTVPLARFFSNNRNDLPFPFKSIQIDESFRAERPQEGRNRQFTQCDIDIWGEKTILGELEIILTAMEAYNKVGIPNVVCKLSSRKLLTKLILSAGFKEAEINDVCIIIDKLEKIGIDGCTLELTEKGFDTTAIEKLTKMILEISKEGIQSCLEFAEAQEEVEQISTLISLVNKFSPSGYSIKFDISVVRGQGYYTGMVYEMFCESSGYRGAIGGGGRYDNMYSKFAGENISAVGFGLGLDSVLLVLKKLGKENLFMNKKLALIYSDNIGLDQILQKKNKLKAEFNVSLFPYPKNFKEFLRKIKLNGFNYLTKVDKDEIEEI